ncbi:NAD(P)/FAD-dependent oxidoreductase [Psychromarinibacter sp. C21-152]|uniref:NAD(P)/FAD-dependent oxidoreductase n=1 Tax=Psychromarinibacter sediminicola TaxID=3033385 RepID=A0AAE3TC41_9RHOB|nr:NAD(P)/FAD-dependent oxidoreductase [Psychromarinibacter sediminicola]MDF0603549.1 NAD(P)/FAD-dependent oxidoreductase [Psychromarinibacter sediminicola]
MNDVIDDWLARFDTALSSGDANAVAELFEPGGYWRDLLAFTWNIHTAEGRPAIRDMLKACLAGTAPSGWHRTTDAEETEDGTAAWIAFRTAVATAEGRVTVRDGRAHILFTAMKDIVGHEEPVGHNRPMGIVHKADRHRETWSEARAKEQARIGREDQPEVLIVGGGQGGVALAARLKQFGVPALIVEKNPRIGDSWRNRYRSLVLHDPVWYDHLPYLPFPETWPVFCPKDKIGDWLEAYALIFELDAWTSTSCDSAQWDADAQRWTATVTKDGEEITLTPKQLVFCTGAYGPPNLPDFPGQSDYRGTLLHSSQYHEGAPFRGKRALVIGAGSSAHDVAVDLWEAGANVTMFQRRPSIVVRSKTLMELGFDIYSQDAADRGLTADRADMLAASTPYALFTAKQQALYKTIIARDADFYAKLDRAGFAYDFGEDDSGLMMRALRTASGYYIDVGASTLIAEGEIGVIGNDEIECLTPEGIRFASGREEQADVIVACTGYQSMNEAVAPIVSRAAADMVGPCWGLGSGIRGDPGPWLGELRNMWKPTAHEGLWFHGGNLALSRFYSRFVALQLKARQLGIPTPVYGRPAPCRVPEDA